jgi:hypothetical protein
MGDEQRPGDKPNVFISYSRDDLSFADQLDAILSVAGFATSIDRHGILGGEDWKRRLGSLIRDADTVVFVLTPASASSDICRWEVEEAVRLGKRIMPVVPRALDGAAPPPRLAELNYIYFYPDPKKPDSGFRSGLIELDKALKTDFEWLREHTRYLQRATEWEAGDKPPNRLLSGADIALAKAWAMRRPKEAPELTALHRHFISASEQWEARQQSEVRQRLEEHNRQLQRERDLALQREQEATELRKLAEKRALDVAGMIATTCEQGASLMFALRGEFGGGRSEALRRLVEQTRKIMEAALDAADKAATTKLQTQGIARPAVQHTAGEGKEAEVLAVAPPTKKAVSSGTLEEKSAEKTGKLNLADVFRMMQMQNEDFANAQTIATQMQTENQRQQMERWKILQDTQTQIFEIQQDLTAQKAATQDKAYKKWDQYIRDIKVDLIQRLMRLAEFLEKSQELRGARKCYQAALAFLEDTDDKDLRVAAESQGSDASQSARVAIEKRLATLNQGPPTS